MTDEFGNETTAPSAERVGFCQDCGKPLTQETVRTVGSGVFCEPCLERRIGTAGQAVPPGTVPGAGAYGAATPYGVNGNGPVPPMTHLPSPTLAGFLGLIPGVGAMYNGQFAKGIAHLVIFFVLSSLSDHVNGAFGILVAGWVFYQAFEAYHTAKARLEGQPLPNPLGLNDIGERMGFGKSWPGSASRPPMNPPVTQWNPTTPPVTTPPPAAAPVPPVPPANWAGYVPPSAFAQPVPPPPAASASQGGAWGSTPYQAASQTSYEAPPQAEYVPVNAGAPLPASIPPAPHSRRFPVAAIVLIVLGALFLLNTILHFSMNGSWVTAAILATLAVWVFAHRVSHVRQQHPEGLEGAAMVSCVLRGPSVLLAVLAVLFALQAANAYTLGQTWPVIVIALGATLLLERTAGRIAQPAYIDPRSSMTPTWATEPAPQYQAPHSQPPVPPDAENGGQR
jgi:TM2 domain-containing membrane protein YozV